MIKLIKHGINLVKHSLRDVGTNAKRSTHWPTVEKHFLAEAGHNFCAACGGTEKLNAHHIVPFHHDSSLELDHNNLITLCMSKCECHLHIGHSGSFKEFNPNVRSDAAKALAHPDQFDEIVKLAFENRKAN